jgi:hypothetical protein
VGLVVASPQEQTVQPCVEAARIAKRADIPPRLHEGGLDRVLGTVTIVNDSHRDRIEPVDRRHGERPERFAIALLRPLDEIQHLRSVRLSPSQGMAVACPETFEVRGRPASCGQGRGLVGERRSRFEGLSVAPAFWPRAGA